MIANDPTGGPRASVPRWLLFACTLMFLMPNAQGTEGLVVQTIGERLREPVATMGATAAGDGILLVGGLADGRGEAQEQVWLFDPSSEQLHLKQARIPGGLALMAVAWMDGSAYLFGGARARGSGNDSDAIWRYEARTDTMEPANARLPRPLILVQAVALGVNIYLFGGYGGREDNLAVLKYNPREDALSETGARLPDGFVVSGAFSDGKAIFLLGDQSNATILSYDPDANAISPSGAALPTPRSRIGVVWTGRESLVFGGCCGGAQPGTDIAAHYDEIVRFTPSSGRVEILPQRLPSGRGYPAAVWTGGAAYVFGGCCLPGEDAPSTDEIIRFGPQKEAQGRATPGINMAELGVLCIFAALGLMSSSRGRSGRRGYRRNEGY